MNAQSINNLTFQELGVFQLFIKTGSISTAAKQLNISHSTCIRSINSMEEKLQITLFHRIRNTYHLTEQGIKLYEPIMLAIRAYASAVSKSSSWSKKLRLLMPIASSYLFAKYYLLEFKRKVHKLNVELITLSTSLFLEFPNLSQIILNNMDLIMIRNEFDHYINPNIWVKIFTKKFPQKIYCSKKYLDQYGEISRPNELADRTCIISSNSSVNVWELTNKKTKEIFGISMKNSIVMDNEAIAAHAVDGGVGVAILTEALVNGDERDDVIEILTNYSVPNNDSALYINRYSTHGNLALLTEIVEKSMMNLK